MSFVVSRAGTNIQTNEEVAIKLVSLLHQLGFGFFQILAFFSDYFFFAFFASEGKDYSES